MPAKTQPTPPNPGPMMAENDDVKDDSSLVVVCRDEKLVGEDMELSEALVRLQDGAVILDADGEHRYVTRYRIDHKLQRAHGMRKVCQEDLIPCCFPEEEGEKKNKSKPKRCCSQCWTILRSELLLLSLHVCVLVIGVMKEGLNLREVDEDLHIVHSIVETLVTCLQVVIRTFNGWSSYRLLVQTAYELEHVESSRSVRGRHMRWQLWAITVLGGFLVAISVTCFLLFYWFAHLGWTILSNNFVLVVITVTSNLYQTRLDRNVWQIREDQHKIVLYETIMLLGDLSSVETPEEMRERSQKLSRFIKALMKTEMFDKPSHITETDSSNMSHADTMLAMQMQFSV